MSSSWTRTKVCLNRWRHLIRVGVVIVVIGASSFWGLLLVQSCEERRKVTCDASPERIIEIARFRRLETGFAYYTLNAKTMGLTEYIFPIERTTILIDVPVDKARYVIIRHYYSRGYCETTGEFHLRTAEDVE